MGEEDKEVEVSLPSIGIPSEVLFNENLLSKDMILFGYIRSLSQSSRGCWASNNYLALLIRDKHPQTVSGRIHKLVELGYFEVQYVDIRRRGRIEQERRIYISDKYMEKYKEMKKKIHDKLFGTEEIQVSANANTPKPSRLGVLASAFNNTDNEDDNEDGSEISNDIYKDSSNPQQLVTNSSEEKPIPLTRTKFPQKPLHERIKEKVGPKVEKPVPVMDPIIVYMNNRLPGPKLRGFKSNGKPYDNYTRVVRYIKQLKSGTHGKFWDLPEDYLKRNYIPHEILSHMFTEKEIKQTISVMSGLYKEGYYTDDKKWLMGLPRDMLIYKPSDIGNPFPQSLFLEVYVNGVRETCYSQIQSEWGTSKYKSQMDTLCEIFQIDEKDTSKRGLILKYMDRMDKFIDSLPNDMGRYSYFVHPVVKGSGPLFMDHYIHDWLATHDKGEWYRDNQNIGCLNITSKLFREYIAFHWDESQIGPVMGMNYAAYGFEYFLNKHLRGETIAERIHQKAPKVLTQEEYDAIGELSDEEYDEQHYYPEHPDERPSVKKAKEEEDTPKVVVDSRWLDPFDVKNYETLDNEPEEDEPE